MEKKTSPKIVLYDLRSWGYEHDHFKIVKIINSIQYEVGSCLHSNEVQELIDAGWTVEVIKK